MREPESGFFTYTARCTMSRVLTPVAELNHDEDTRKSKGSKKSPALAVAATLTTVGAPTQAQVPPDALEAFNPFGARQAAEPDPLLGPGPKPSTPNRRGRRAEPIPDQPRLDRMVEPFGFLGFDVSWSSDSYTVVYPVAPRIAPTVGAGIRFKPDSNFSFQTELAVDFVGGTYPYIIYNYVYAATYLNLPLLARHRIGKSSGKERHFTWGLTFGQLLGESYNETLAGIPVNVEPVGDGSYGYYGYSYGYSFNVRQLSASIGYQGGKYKPTKWHTEFDMRFNLGLTNLGSQGDRGVAWFSFRWNIVPPSSAQ